MAEDPVGIERVPVAVETRWPGGRTNAYLVGDASALLVDPPAVDDRLTAAVEARGVGHVAVTHTHADHVGAVDHYAGLTGATVWAMAGRAGRFAEATGRAPDRTFQDGDAVGPATAIATPGHAPDHASFRVGDRALVGDLAVESGSVVVGGDDGDLRAYLVSLRRLRHAGLATLYPGHGPVIEAADATLERLLAHRLDRERRVLEAVEAGARELDGVVEAAYEKDLTGVADLARLTVAAHLEKLAVEGRVTWDGERAGVQ
ncbi:MAG: MBL fold metallo-hydrolase [Halobacteriales archaeon]|nr:MBL fold metallo-hydrolase [Halobacteriales archaeon]